MKFKFRKKHFLAFVLVFVIVGVVRVGSSVSPSPLPSITPFPTVTTSPVSNGCDASLWNHIYNSQRLQVIESCKSVVGTIEVVRIEKDGDFHVLLKLDNSSDITSNPNFQVNVSKQHGDLVFEPICENPVSQQDVLDQGVCNGFSQNFQPKVGQHVKVTGSFVLDQQHGWLELHPVDSIEILP